MRIFKRVTIFLDSCHNGMPISSLQRGRDTLESKSFPYTGDELVFLVPYDANRDMKEHSIFLERNIHSILNIKSFRMGISSSKGIEEIHAGCREAQEALHISSVIHPNKTFCFFNEIGIFRVIRMISEKQDMADSLLKVIQPVLDYDSKNNSNLFATLDCYYRNNGNIKATAIEMFCHFNTINYGWNRIYPGLECQRFRQHFPASAGDSIVLIFAKKAV
ncbi:PucR family transcriptional regulator [Paenibacillus solisilvae]|uniref:PucR family transcriptional regulator n=1 Tax=Paenibacillus solisilvae TaxID=2486751 RepID=A0ABW0W0R4_9BACL